MNIIIIGLPKSIAVYCSGNDLYVNAEIYEKMQATSEHQPKITCILDKPLAVKSSVRGDFVNARI